VDKYIPVLFIFVPIISAVLIYLIKNKAITHLVFLTQIVLAILFGYYLYQLQQNPSISYIVLGGWNDRFAITLKNDSLSLLFIGLSIFMWTAVIFYTFKTNRKYHKYLFFLMFLEGIFLAFLQTNDLFNLFVFLELITVLITILIAFKKNGPSLKAAIYYLLLNTLGAMFFLIGIIILYYTYGSINITYLASHITEHSNEAIVKFAYIMMISGISVKSALFPLYTWLPRAHGVAYTSLSALLSGLLVKGGLYLFIRIHVYMFGYQTYQMSEVLFYIGAITALSGVVLALSQKDLKQILAHHTISQIGIMVMGLSFGYGLSYYGGLFHLVNHALFKSLLFLCAGIIIYGYKTKKIYAIKGVFKSMPLTSVFLIIGMLAITGAPFFNGYVSKTLVKYSFKEEPFKMFLFTLINIGTVTSFLKFSQILFGDKVKVDKRKDTKQFISIITIGIICILIGIFYKELSLAIFNIDLSYVKIFDFRAWLDYLLYIVIGYVLYRYYISKDYKPIKVIREYQVSFESANYLFIFYIAVLSLMMYYIF
jgi:multicomponent Na+:H+ antiporter subunit D